MTVYRYIFYISLVLLGNKLVIEGAIENVASFT